MAAARLQQVRARNILKATVPMNHHDIIRFGEGRWDVVPCYVLVKLLFQLLNIF